MWIMNESAHPFRFQIAFQPVPLGTSYDILMPNVFSLTSGSGSTFPCHVYVRNMPCDSALRRLPHREYFNFTDKMQLANRPCGCSPPYKDSHTALPSRNYPKLEPLRPAPVIGRHCSPHHPMRPNFWSDRTQSGGIAQSSGVKRALQSRQPAKPHRKPERYPLQFSTRNGSYVFQTFVPKTRPYRWTTIIARVRAVTARSTKEVSRLYVCTDGSTNTGTSPLSVMARTEAT